MATRSVSSGQIKIKNSINDHVNALAKLSTIPSSTTRYHQRDKDLIGRVSNPNSFTITTATTSNPEFRNGYRLQRRAYERRSQTPTLASIINNRRPKNEYVDRLKEFYYLDAESDVQTNPDKGGSNRFVRPFSVKRMSTGQKQHDNPENIKSILRIPDTKSITSAKGKNTVKLVLPSDSPSALQKNNSTQSYATGFTTKVPPPVPFLLSSLQTRKEETESDLSSSLSSNVASSILAAVSDFKKTSSNSGGGRSQRSYQHQRRRKKQFNTNTRSDPNSLAMKVSLPCRIGCCYCVYSSILGPVKIFMTRSQRPKQGPWVAGIRDGYGRLVIPISRKSDVTGLVYDAHSHSLHPPAKGERPLFPSPRVFQKESTSAKEQKGARTYKSNRKDVNKRS